MMRRRMGLLLRRDLRVMRPVFGGRAGMLMHHPVCRLAEIVVVAGLAVASVWWLRCTGQANLVVGEEPFVRHGAEGEAGVMPGAPAVAPALAEVTGHIPVPNRVR